jgi:hypothetical protein
MKPKILENIDCLTNERKLISNNFDIVERCDTKRSLTQIRSANCVSTGKSNQCTSEIWNRAPIDFSLKLYHPQWSKRNLKKSLKLSSREKKSSANLKYELNDYDSIKALIYPFIFANEQRIMKTEQPIFYTSFRLKTSSTACIEASKSMGFRDGLEQYRNPKPHDFRGVKRYFDFKCSFLFK